MNEIKNITITILPTSFLSYVSTVPSPNFHVFGFYPIQHFLRLYFLKFDDHKHWLQLAQHVLQRTVSVFEMDFPNQYLRNLDTVYVEVLCAKIYITNLHFRLFGILNEYIFISNCTFFKYLIKHNTQHPKYRSVIN